MLNSNKNFRGEIYNKKEIYNDLVLINIIEDEQS